MGESERHVGSGSGASFDPVEISQVFEDDVDAVLDLIGLVTADLPRYAQALTNHVRRAEWPEAGRLAHTIKGAAANVYADPVKRLAQTVEHAAKQGRLESIADDTGALTAAVAALVQALEQWAARLRAERKVA
jgi:histidine phosphotransfer protein HptB